MTDAEGLLWARWRRRQLHGHLCRRQHAICPYIAELVGLAEHIIHSSAGPKPRPSGQNRRGTPA
ncbi:MAG: DUF559 domain-containing protein [Candidatus Schekmanbacteria bacterium]|nr:DUF559 domain-containing protein [Candidatus Schekmanbacteria bacterium]